MDVQLCYQCFKWKSLNNFHSNNKNQIRSKCIFCTQLQKEQIVINKKKYIKLE